MLLPKRVKYRKQFRGRMKGKASAGMLVLYMASVAVAQLVPYLENVALRTMLADWLG